MFLFCRGEKGVATKGSNLLLNILHLRCPRDIHVELSTPSWTCKSMVPGRVLGWSCHYGSHWHKDSIYSQETQWDQEVSRGRKGKMGRANLESIQHGGLGAWERVSKGDEVGANQEAGKPGLGSRSKARRPWCQMWESQWGLVIAYIWWSNLFGSSATFFIIYLNSFFLIPLLPFSQHCHFCASSNGNCARSCHLFPAPMQPKARIHSPNAETSS